MGSDHECFPGHDPRFKRSCVRCGRLLPEPAAVGMPRDRVSEREFASRAARAWGLDANPLWAFADARAHDGPVRVEGRDFGVEGLEELADFVNYMGWLRLWIVLYCPNDPWACDALPLIGEAIAAAVYAASVVQRVRGLVARVEVSS